MVRVGTIVQEVRFGGHLHLSIRKPFVWSTSRALPCCNLSFFASSFSFLSNICETPRGNQIEFSMFYTGCLVVRYCRGIRPPHRCRRKIGADGTRTVGSSLGSYRWLFPFRRRMQVAPTLQEEVLKQFSGGDIATWCDSCMQHRRSRLLTRLRHCLILTLESRRFAYLGSQTVGRMLIAHKPNLRPVWNALVEV